MPSRGVFSKVCLAAFVVYSVVLVLSTHWPGVVIAGPVPRPDLFVHLGAFSVWTVLLGLSGLVGRCPWRLVGWAVVFLVADETTQPLFERQFDWLDLLANFGGVLIGLGVMTMWWRRKHGRDDRATVEGHRRDACATGAKGHGRDACVTGAGDLERGRDARDTGEASLGRDTRTVAGLTLVSRVLGLVRDLVTVRVFGDTAVGSAFAAAFAIPNMFRRLFGEGALSAAFIPEYTTLSDEDPDAADRFASLVVGALALITGAITVVIELGLLAVLVLAPGDEHRALSLKLIMVCLPFMPAICIAAILGGMLQARGRFGPWAAAPVLLNLCVIAAALPYFFLETDASTWAYPIAGAAVLSGVLQVLWSLWALRGMVRWTRAFGDVGGRARVMLRRMVPVLIGLGTLQVNSFVDTLIAMWPNWVGPTIFGHGYPLDERANAILFYSQRLYQFPLGVFGIAVATAAFPVLARDAKDPARFASTLGRGVRLSLFIGLPATFGLLAVRGPLVEVLYSGMGDGFSAEGVRRASAVLLGYSAAVWAYSLNQLYTRAFYAAGDTRTPMRIAVTMVGANVTLNCVLIWWLSEAGLAWSTALCATGQLVWLRRAAHERLLGGARPDGSVWSAGVGHLIGGALCGLAAFGVVRVWGGPADSPGGWGMQAVRLGLAVIAGAGVFGAWSVVRGCPEQRWLLGRSVGSKIEPTQEGDRDDEQV